jgi:polyisoprenoid-binding protein YceI
MSLLTRGLPSILLVGVLLFSGSSLAADVKAKSTEVVFHISHPAKKYDAALLPGGADIVGSFEPTDLAKTGFDIRISVDKFNSDNTRRDSHMMEVLEGLIFPYITWKVREVDGLMELSRSGQPLPRPSALGIGPIKAGTFKGYASGPLTVHGVTKILDARIEMTITESGEVTVTSSFSISLEDFEIERPTLVFVPIADELPIEVKVIFPGGAGIFPPDSPADVVPDSVPAEEEATTAPVEE